MDDCSDLWIVSPITERNNVSHSKQFGNDIETHEFNCIDKQDDYSKKKPLMNFFSIDFYGMVQKRIILPKLIHTFDKMNVNTMEL